MSGADDDRGEPQRPRLAEHVLARQHVLGSEAFVVLHDEQRGTLERIDRRTWTVLSMADGTRDLEGIRLAASRLGAQATIGSVRAFFDDLARRGMLEEGPPSYEPDRVTNPAGREHIDAHVVERLQGFTLHCDGSGACCRVYQTILFTPEDVTRARAWVPRPKVEPVPAERMFVPLRGSAPMPLQTVTLRDAGCAYLDPDGRCAIHVAGGPSAKPIGCRTFPLHLCDDGTALRQGLRFECACVFESIARPGGSALLDECVRIGADLAATAHVETLPERVELRHAVDVSRASLRAWTEALLKLPDHDDPAARLWAWADEIEHEGLRPDGPIADPLPVSPARVQPWVAALHDLAATRLQREAAWRMPADWSVQALRWLVATTAVVRRPEVWAEVLTLRPPVLDHESFYVRATAFAYAWVDGRPLATSLRDRAVRLWLARCMPTFAGLVPDQPAWRHPLSVIETLMRVHGLVRYAEAIGASRQKS